jgi:hypothetical protein
MTIFDRQRERRASLIPVEGSMARAIEPVSASFFVGFALIGMLSRRGTRSRKAFAGAAWNKELCPRG